MKMLVCKFTFKIAFNDRTSVNTNRNNKYLNDVEIDINFAFLFSQDNNVYKLSLTISGVTQDDFRGPFVFRVGGDYDKAFERKIYLKEKGK